METTSPQLRNDWQKLLSSLSFSHFTEILELDDPLKRVFYEVECIRGGWSVRELRRQIATLYYERSGLSTDKNKLAALVQSKAERAESRLTIRDPYVFKLKSAFSVPQIGQIVSAQSKVTTERESVVL